MHDCVPSPLNNGRTPPALYRRGLCELPLSLRCRHGLAELPRTQRAWCFARILSTLLTLRMQESGPNRRQNFATMTPDACSSEFRALYTLAVMALGHSTDACT